MTSVMLGSPFVFFQAKLTVFLQPEAEIARTSKRLTVETSNLELRWGTYGTTFVQVF